jgi:hypothetical protein
MNFKELSNVAKSIESKMSSVKKYLMVHVEACIIYTTIKNKKIKKKKQNKTKQKKNSN